MGLKEREGFLSFSPEKGRLIREENLFERWGLMEDSRYSQTHCYLSYLGSFTSLTVTFPFKRRMGYYIIQVYIPCVFLVMLSWIVFWMRPDDSASRLTVGITTILTIVFLLGYTNGMLPKVF